MADADVVITLKAKDEASKTLSMGFTELKSKLDLVAQAFRTVAQVAEKAFEIGRQGAVVEQTTKSFDRLLRVVGVAPGLLDRLREASNGTIDDIGLMSSTMTLAAGAGNDMAKTMLEISPQILEIAKAASALNPTLGDTTFLYNSLMTGIKRGSPMLIDNTGLTLKLGEANEKYAKSLGKTVEELTSTEQKQALINATLEAGANLINQVGGETDSAVDSFDKLTTSMKNWTDQASRQSVPVLGKVAEGLTAIVEASITRQNAFDKLRQSLESGLITEQEYQKLYRETTTVFGDYTEVYEFLITLGAERTQELDREAQKVQNLNAAQEYSNDLTTESAQSTQEWGTALEDLYAATAEAENGVKGLDTATGHWIDTIDTGLSGAIQKAIEKIEWFAAGGLELQAAFNETMQQLRNDVITPAEAEAKFRELFVQSEMIAGKINGLTFDQIAENISAGLGIPLYEAYKMASDVADQVRALDGMTATIKIAYTYSNAPGSGTAAETGGRASGEAGDTRQAGGPVWAGRPILVGEAGPEWFTPPSNGYITNNTTSFNMTVNTGAASSTVISDFALMQAMAGA